MLFYTPKSMKIRRNLIDGALVLSVGFAFWGNIYSSRAMSSKVRSSDARAPVSLDQGRSGARSGAPEASSSNLISASPVVSLNRLIEHDEIELATDFIEGWAQVEPDAALAWFQDEIDRGTLQQTGVFEKWRRSPLLAGLLAGVATTDPAHAWKLFSDAEKDARMIALSRLSHALLKSGKDWQMVWDQFQDHGAGKSESRHLLREFSKGLIYADRGKEVTSFMNARGLSPDERASVYRDLKYGLMAEDASAEGGISIIGKN